MFLLADDGEDGGGLSAGMRAAVDGRCVVMAFCLGVHLLAATAAGCNSHALATCKSSPTRPRAHTRLDACPSPKPQETRQVPSLGASRAAAAAATVAQQNLPRVMAGAGGGRRGGGGGGRLFF